jgi:N-dimethylarginine dimethylaminohydrolase
MSVWTNWDPLEEVIVGDCYAPGDLDWSISPDLQPAFNNVLAETKQDLDNLAELLTNLGIQVHRPKVLQYQQSIDLSSFSVQCPMAPIVPRDQYLVYGDTVFQTYTSMTDRYLDSYSYYDIFKRLFDQGHNWLSQPVPNLRNLPPGKNWMNQGRMIYDHLFHNQVLWHTATMFKCGEHLITNTTGPGSQAGLKWMRRNLPKDTVIENINTTVRNWGHIDHGFFMTDDNTVICVDRNFVPECLRNKTLHEVYSYLPKETVDPATPIDNLLDPSKGYEQVVVFDTNVLVVDSHNVIFDHHMPEFFKFLTSIGIKSHVSQMRHRKFWAAGIHCVTLDIRRCGNKRKIVNEI